MRVSYLPSAEIASAINVLLLLESDDNTTAEVDVVSICLKHFGLAIHFTDLQEAYGENTLGMVIAEHKLIFCDNSIEPIGENKTVKERIMRFTVAHELGHYLFHQEYMTSDRPPLFYHELSEVEKTRVEIQANIFAAMLLMPEKPFTETYDLLKAQELKSKTIVERLSELFNVSKESVGYRIEAVKQSREKKEKK